MDIFPKPIQQIIYRYIYQCAIKQGFSEIFPITPESTPFSMDSTYTTNNGIGYEYRIEYDSFRSTKCEMCYTRNVIDSNRHLYRWIRCYHVLKHIDIYTSRKGLIYMYVDIIRPDNNGYNGYTELKINNKTVPRDFTISLYKQIWDLQSKKFIQTNHYT